MIDPITILADTGLITVLIYPDGSRVFFYYDWAMN